MPQDNRKKTTPSSILAQYACIRRRPIRLS